MNCFKCENDIGNKVVCPHCAYDNKGNNSFLFPVGSLKIQEDAHSSTEVGVFNNDWESLINEFESASAISNKAYSDVAEPVSAISDEAYNDEAEPVSAISDEAYSNEAEPVVTPISPVAFNEVEKSKNSVGGKTKSKVKRVLGWLLVVLGLCSCFGIGWGIGTIVYDSGMRCEYDGSQQTYNDLAFTIENGVLKDFKTDFFFAIVPEGVTSIGDQAFSGCEKLMFVKFPSTLTSIGYEAFYDCSNLTSIKLPDSVTSIGESAFQNTGYYNDDNNWENGVLYIGKHLITTDGQLSGQYEIKAGTLTVADLAFSCDIFTSIIIPDSVTSIGESAFESCHSLTSIEIPDSVTSIGESAFKYCMNLSSIKIPDSVTSIGKRAFECCHSLTSIEIPVSVTSIGEYTFMHCKSLTSIKIPDSVTSIGERAFKCCNNLSSIEIPDSVTRVECGAFEDCSSLESVSRSLTTSVDACAFEGCDNLNKDNIEIRVGS